MNVGDDGDAHRGRNPNGGVGRRCAPALAHRGAGRAGRPTDARAVRRSRPRACRAPRLGAAPARARCARRRARRTRRAVARATAAARAQRCCAPPRSACSPRPRCSSRACRSGSRRSGGSGATGSRELGYGTWLFDLLGPLVVRAALLGFACAACLWLAGRLGRRWWLAAAPVFVVVGVAVIVVQPLLSPRLEPVRASRGRPAGRGARGPRGAAAARRRGATHERAHAPAERGGTRDRADDARDPLGVDARAARSRARLPRRARARAREALASLEGAGVVRAAARAGARAARPARAAYERPRTSRARSSSPSSSCSPRRRSSNAISRRYEAEADWVALETTRDPVGAKRFLADLAEAGVRDPSPPRWWTIPFGTHPTLAERAGMADASGRRSREGP